jgi:CubicO group peptidase (beta-lactamase class C family)
MHAFVSRLPQCVPATQSAIPIIVAPQLVLVRPEPTSNAQQLVDMAEWVTTAAFAARVNALMRDFHVPGLSVAVLDGDTVHTRTFGQASIESSTPVDVNTIFDAASCSKALTGVAMGILVDSHSKLSRLGWKTPVTELIGDDFVMNRIEDTNVITVEHLLSHTSGFSG